MIVPTPCPVCGSNHNQIYPARCSPFFAERVWKTPPPSQVSFISCNCCGFMYYYPPPRQSELARLYCGYRSDEYQQQRQQHEPEYTPEQNERLQAEAGERKSHIAATITNYVLFAGIHSVLDYGGDAGQSIPDEFTKSDKYVYDISGTPLPKGIQRCYPDTPKTFDYIQCCHVLEHVPDPHAVMKDILKFSHQQTVFYFEVPTESGFIIAALKFFSKHRELYRIYASIFNKDPEGMFPAMHEHLGLFTEPLLILLMTMHGLKIKALEIQNNTISCVAVKKGAA
jgi:hypothetical protein